MDNLKILDRILLSDNVTKNFHEEYNNNSSFKSWLLNILPAVEDCINQEQNNPWHKYNVMDHILHSVEAMNKQTTEFSSDARRLLAYTMFYHDIGKPSCHIVREKHGEMIDSFFGHNEASSKIVCETAKEFGFDENETKILNKLVLKHDIFMNLRTYTPDNPFLRELTQEVVQEEIADLNFNGNGKELLRCLVMVGRADNLAQNEKMTKHSLGLLTVFDKMLDEIDEDICSE